MKKLIRINTFETNSSSAHTLTVAKSYDLLEIKSNKRKAFLNLKNHLRKNELLVTLIDIEKNDQPVKTSYEKLTCIISDQLSNYYKHSIYNNKSDIFPNKKVSYAFNQYHLLIKEGCKDEELLDQHFKVYYDYVCSNEKLQLIKQWIKEEFDLDLKIILPCYSDGKIRMFGTDHESKFFTSKVLVNKQTFINFLINPKSHLNLKHNY